MSQVPSLKSGLGLGGRGQGRWLGPDPLPEIPDRLAGGVGPFGHQRMRRRLLLRNSNRGFNRLVGDSAVRTVAAIADGRQRAKAVGQSCDARFGDAVRRRHGLWRHRAGNQRSLAAEPASDFSCPSIGGRPVGDRPLADPAAKRVACRRFEARRARGRPARASIRRDSRAEPRPARPTRRAAWRGRSRARGRRVPSTTRERTSVTSAMMTTNPASVNSTAARVGNRFARDTRDSIWAKSEAGASRMSVVSSGHERHHANRRAAAACRSDRAPAPNRRSTPCSRRGRNLSGGIMTSAPKVPSEMRRSR